MNFAWDRGLPSGEREAGEMCTSLAGKGIGRTVCSSDIASWPPHPTGLFSFPNIVFRPLMYILQLEKMLKILALNFKQVRLGEVSLGKMLQVSKSHRNLTNI